MTNARRIFGRRKNFGEAGMTDAAAPAATMARPFGQRRPRCEAAQPVVAAPGMVTFSAVAKARLGGICRDLNNLYRDPAFPHEAPLFEMHELPGLMLTIGRHGTVQVDEARGLYVLRIDGRKPGTVTIETANDEVLLDHIICHLARDRERFFSVTAHGLVSALVGRSLEEVERSLILATLRQHHFNRTRAAQVLGLSVRTIRNKLKDYRAEDTVADRDGDVFRLRGRPPPA